MSERDELARAIYALGPYGTNVGADGKLMGYTRDLTFDEIRDQDPFYILADGILAAGYRKVAPPVPFDAPPIEGPWYY